QAGFPAHGFARTSEFRFEGCAEHGDNVVCELSLASSPATRALFPHAFQARVRLSVGRELSLAFEVENLDDEAFDYELALHSYLGVSDARQVELSGLEGASYDDKVTGVRGNVEGNTPVRFQGETDRVYASTARVTLRD